MREVELKLSTSGYSRGKAGTIAAFVVIILGGLGNLYGGLLGAAVLAIVEVYGVAMTSSAYRSILVYGIFIAILLIRPEGLLAPRKYR